MCNRNCLKVKNTQVHHYIQEEWDSEMDAWERVQETERIFRDALD